MNSLNGKTSEKRIPHELIIDNKPNNEITGIIEKLNQYFSTICKITNRSRARKFTLWPQ